jgi:hypothetical protein
MGVGGQRHVPVKNRYKMLAENPQGQEVFEDLAYLIFYLWLV